LRRGHSQVEQHAVYALNTTLHQDRLQFHEMRLHKQGAISECTKSFATRINGLKISIDSEQNSVWLA
jgi:hypothetical protein